MYGGPKNILLYAIDSTCPTRAWRRSPGSSTCRFMHLYSFLLPLRLFLPLVCFKAVCSGQMSGLNRRMLLLFLEYFRAAAGSAGAACAAAAFRLKYVDLLDTVFMIVRGNWRQVSFLHVYHHSSVIYISWVNASVGYDGEIYYVVALKYVLSCSVFFLLISIRQSIRHESLISLAVFFLMLSFCLFCLCCCCRSVRFLWVVLSCVVFRFVSSM